MTRLKKLSTLAAKTESTVGTAETLGVSDGTFNAYDLKIDGEIEVEEREAQGSFDYLPGTPGSRKGKMSFKIDMELKGTGLTTWASVLLPACGYVSSAQIFTPRSEAPGSNVKTLTIGAFQDGVLKRLAGAVGTYKFNAVAGKRVPIEWEFEGVWQPPIDSALISPTYPDPAVDEAVRFASATITYNSVAQCVQSMVFDAGNQITMRECPDTAAGFKSAIIVDRKPTITINPEAQLVATEDRYGDWIAGNEYAFSCAFARPSGGTMTLAAPKAQIMNLAEGDRDGILIDEAELMCNKSGSNKDQNVALTFTDA